MGVEQEHGQFSTKRNRATYRPWFGYIRWFRFILFCSQGGFHQVNIYNPFFYLILFKIHESWRHVVYIVALLWEISDSVVLISIYIHIYINFMYLNFLYLKFIGRNFEILLLSRGSIPLRSFFFSDRQSDTPYICHIYAQYHSACIFIEKCILKIKFRPHMI